MSKRRLICKSKQCLNKHCFDNLYTHLQMSITHFRVSSNQFIWNSGLILPIFSHFWGFFIQIFGILQSPDFCLRIRCFCSIYGKINFTVFMKVIEKHASGFLGSWAKYHVKFRAFRVHQTHFRVFRVH